MESLFKPVLMKLINKIQFISVSDCITDHYSYCTVPGKQLSVGIVFYDDIVMRVLVGNTITEVNRQVKQEYKRVAKSSKVPYKLDLQIVKYLSGEPIAFECKAALWTNGFTARVINKCSKVPYGEVLTYSGLAAKAGNGQAARAAGTAMRNNRCPLLVPCHRVIKANGEPGRYSAGSGTATKVMLLDMEKSNT